MTGVAMIAAERQRQLTDLQRSIEKDLRESPNGELVFAAGSVLFGDILAPIGWELVVDRAKGLSKIEKLAVAGSLIAAEIDRVLAQTGQLYEVSKE